MHELPSVTYISELSINLEPFTKEGRDLVWIVTFTLTNGSRGRLMCIA
jgi:hypothetical protein